MGQTISICKLIKFYLIKKYYRFNNAYVNFIRASSALKKDCAFQVSRKHTFMGPIPMVRYVLSPLRPKAFHPFIQKFNGDIFKYDDLTNFVRTA